MRFAWKVCELVAVVAVAACGGSNQRPDAGNEPVDAAADGAVDAASIDAPTDAPIDAPGTPLTVLVAKSGSDLFDGITMPVETLKRGIQIAASNPRVVAINIGPGRYSTRSNETFGYEVPRNVVVSGSGVLVGSGLETALTFTDGEIQSVQLENFDVAIEATGNLRMKNIKIVGSATGIHAGSTAKLRIDNLELTGPATGDCTRGIVLEGELFATTLIANNVAPVLDASSPGPIDIATATLTSRQDCSRPNVDVRNASRTIALRDATVEIGTAGIRVVGAPSMRPQVTLTNVSVRRATVGVAATGVLLQMTGGSIFGGRIGLDGHDGSYTLDGVMISGVNNAGNPDSGGLIVEGSATAPAALVMRRCQVHSNFVAGIVVGDHASADLGTAASPGNNLMPQNFGTTIDVRGQAGQGQVNAAGNTWRPDTQGSDADGRYPPQLILGPVVPPDGLNNFALAAGWSLQL